MACAYGGKKMRRLSRVVARCAMRRRRDARRHSGGGEEEEGDGFMGSRPGDAPAIMLLCVLVCVCVFVCVAAVDGVGGCCW